MDGDRHRRQQIAAAAFAERRRELQLTQEQVAQRGDLVVRTVQNFESQGRWPNRRTRAQLERAVTWPLGEIDRLAAERKASPRLPGETIDQALERIQKDLDQLREEHRRSQEKGNGHEDNGVGAA